MASPSPNWSNSSLRRRSFHGQNLEGANFQGSDLRGCDFSQARLQGANFAHAKTGLALESLIWGIILMTGSGVFGFQLLTLIIFSILGLSGDDPSYHLRVAFIALIAFLGGLTAIFPRLQRHPLLTIISRQRYGHALQTIMCRLIRFIDRLGVGIVLKTLGLACANGTFFVAGINALHALSVRHWGTSIPWGLLALLYFGFTLQAAGQLYKALKRIAWTTFEGADLSQVHW